MENEFRNIEVKKEDNYIENPKEIKNNQVREINLEENKEKGETYIERKEECKGFE